MRQHVVLVLHVTLLFTVAHPDSSKSITSFLFTVNKHCNNIAYLFHIFFIHASVVGCVDSITDFVNRAPAIVDVCTSVVG